MASVSEIQQTISQAYNQQTVSETTDSDLDKDAFLQLLVTQMQYQDPLNPTTNEDFLAQMAQFSALEQMQNLNTNFQMQQTFSLIGKYVTATSLSSDTSYIEGVVDGVSIISGTAYLQIGDDYVSIDDIVDVRNEVSEVDTETEEVDATETDE